MQSSAHFESQRNLGPPSIPRRSRTNVEPIVSTNATMRPTVIRRLPRRANSAPLPPLAIRRHAPLLRLPCIASRRSSLIPKLTLAPATPILPTVVTGVIPMAVSNPTTATRGNGRLHPRSYTARSDSDPPALMCSISEAGSAENTISELATPVDEENFFSLGASVYPGAAKLDAKLSTLGSLPVHRRSLNPVLSIPEVLLRPSTRMADYVELSKIRAQAHNEQLMALPKDDDYCWMGHVLTLALRNAPSDSEDENMVVPDTVSGVDKFRRRYAHRSRSDGDKETSKLDGWIDIFIDISRRYQELAEAEMQDAGLLEEGERTNPESAMDFLASLEHAILELQERQTIVAFQESYEYELGEMVDRLQLDDPDSEIGNASELTEKSELSRINKIYGRWRPSILHDATEFPNVWGPLWWPHCYERSDTAGISNTARAYNLSGARGILDAHLHLFRPDWLTPIAIPKGTSARDFTSVQNGNLESSSVHTSDRDDEDGGFHRVDDDTPMEPLITRWVNSLQKMERTLTAIASSNLARLGRDGVLEDVLSSLTPRRPPRSPFSLISTHLPRLATHPRMANAFHLTSEMRKKMHFDTYTADRESEYPSNVQGKQHNRPDISRLKCRSRRRRTEGQSNSNIIQQRSLYLDGTVTKWGDDQLVIHS